MRNKSLSRKGLLWEFGTWAVTFDGVVNLKGPQRFVVHWDRIDEPWVKYVARRHRWANLVDFYAALKLARELRKKWPKLEKLAATSFHGPTRRAPDGW